MASGSASGSGYWSQREEEGEEKLGERLKRAWRNEKASPDILHFHSELVQEATEEIQKLEEAVEAFTENGAKAENGVDELIVSLYQMDLDRMLFLLRSYLRMRLQKIEKYTIHVLKTNLRDRLSEQEKTFAERCADIMEKHLDQTVLARLPYGYQSIMKQSISSEEDDMIPEPQLDTFVFCKTKEDVGAFQMDDIGKETIDLLANDLYVLRYKSIKGLVEGGQIDLV
ncbi:DNA replication complex GINS protein SLD5 [Iris pallida]|uniref:DNA replication complex GINS protein SLD5 n=1 Tax=Iris pallida TaxID=29817 RepID=A0AAX6HGW8_IRIPA|nr:DNA replication complex GINS protein SLD5 [Iris pallida]